MHDLSQNFLSFNITFQICNDLLLCCQNDCIWSKYPKLSYPAFVYLDKNLV
uniref:Uncharacterized protein n=1 Tax=Rhizophora mucronata TaxID=61149 RepID=A0A2P2MZU0_RHIMU